MCTLISFCQLCLGQSSKCLLKRTIMWWKQWRRCWPSRCQVRAICAWIWCWWKHQNTSYFYWCDWFQTHTNKNILQRSMRCPPFRLHSKFSPFNGSWRSSSAFCQRLPGSIQDSMHQRPAPQRPKHRSSALQPSHDGQSSRGSQQDQNRCSNRNSILASVSICEKSYR